MQNAECRMKFKGSNRLHFILHSLMLHFREILPWTRPGLNAFATT
jgi:hypothetical protein